MSISDEFSEYIMGQMERVATARGLDLLEVGEDVREELAAAALVGIEKVVSDYIETHFSEVYELLEVPMLEEELPDVHCTFASGRALLFWREDEQFRSQRVKVSNLPSDSLFKVGSMKAYLYDLLRESPRTMKEIVDAFKDRGYIPQDMTYTRCRERMGPKIDALRKKCTVKRDEGGRYFVL